MPQDITDVATFTDPIVMPADSDSANLTYITTLAQGLANRTRHNRSRIEEVEDRATDLESLVRPDVSGSQGAYIHAIGGAATAWASAETRLAWEPGDGFMQSINTTSVYSLRFGIQAGGPLPSQCQITGVRVFLKPGAARATPTDRMRVRAYRQVAGGAGLPDLSLVAVGSDVRDDGTTDIQGVSVGFFLPFSLSNAPSDTYAFTNVGLVIRVDCGSTADIDRVYCAEVRYSTVIL